MQCRRSMDLLAAARFEAIGIAAVTNSLIAVWDAKFTYMFWRPVTAIQAGDTDGNNETTRIRRGFPSLRRRPTPNTPPLTRQSARARSRSTRYGSRRISSPWRSQETPARFVTTQRRRDPCRGRQRAGVGRDALAHSTEVGTKLGSRVGKYTARHLLKPLDDRFNGQRECGHLRQLVFRVTELPPVGVWRHDGHGRRLFRAGDSHEPGSMASGRRRLRGGAGARPGGARAVSAEACRDDSIFAAKWNRCSRRSTPLVVDHEVLGVAAVVLEGLSRLEPGTAVGPYRVEALLGAGGMGEVYRARDTKLNREIALKVLQESLTRDPDRLARFTREANVLASLNHLNIAAIYGFEDGGDVHALVLELVEGPTLADRIARGPLALPEALPIARQIADALAVAHEHGVIHRDLKPANIKVCHDGTVKVLDFGLAKPLQDAQSEPSDAPIPTAQSPMVMSPVVTAMGVILGTAAYMSPEQAKGRTADKRSDVWPFGCVLYEILTGKRAFEGEDVSDTLASVLKAQPDWTALPPQTPTAVRRLLRRALEKDSRRRLSDMADARLEIEETQELAIADAPREIIRPGGTTRLQRALPWTIAATLAAGLITTILVWKSWRAAPVPLSQYLSVDLGADASLSGSVEGMRQLAISPDGSMLAFVGERDRLAQLYLRRFGQLHALPLVTGPVSDPFFSPDGQWVGFFSIADGKLKKVSVAGGSAVTICDTDSFASRGASWGEDQSIVFNPYSQAWTHLLRVASAGGKPESITTLSEGEVAHRWPQVLPGANAILFAAFGTQGGSTLPTSLPSACPAALRKSSSAVRTTPATFGADTSSTRREQHCSESRSTSTVSRSRANQSRSSRASGPSR